MKKLLFSSLVCLFTLSSTYSQELVNLTFTLTSVSHNFQCGNDGAGDPDPRYDIDLFYGSSGNFTFASSYFYNAGNNVPCGTISLNTPITTVQGVCANQVRLNVAMWEEDGCGSDVSFNTCDIFTNGGNDDDNFSNAFDQSSINLFSGNSGITNLQASGSGGYVARVQVQWTKVPAPIISGTDILCENDNFNLVATASQTVSGATFRWYDAATGGNLLHTGANFQPLATASTTYYVEYGTTNCSTERTPFMVTVNPAAPVPTGSSNQSICNAGVLSDLNVTGNNLTYYDTPTGNGTASYTSSTPVFDGMIVYIEDESIAGCKSPARLQVTVDLILSPEPAVSGVQNICNGGIVSDLHAAGDNIQWYDALTGGNLLNGSDVLVDGNIYYAQQTINGCNSPRASSLANFISISDQTFSPATDEFCSSGSTTIDLTATENGTSYYLRDNTNDAIIDGPIVGDGNGISLSTGTISSSMTYNVFAEKKSMDAVDLTSNNDYIEFNSPFSNYGSDITIESWIYFDGTEHAWAGQASPNTDSQSSNVWIWHDGIFYINDAGIWRSINFPVITNAGWVHVATVANSSGLFIYYNGVEVASTPTGISSGIQSSPSSIVRLGQDPRFPSTVTTRNSNVIFDNFKIWNTSKSELEIFNSYNNCYSGSIVGLTQYTLFEEGTGSNVASLVGSSGNVVNSTTWVEGSGVCQTVNCSKELAGTATVTILSPATGIAVVTECVSYDWIDGNTYTASNNTATHTLVGAAANGCDSIVTLDLTILPAATGTAVVTECVSYDWIDGNTYTASNNTATHTLVGAAANGCDSIVTLDLTILPAATGTAVVTECITYDWIDGNTYTASNNTATHTLVGVAANGCDSIVTLDLTILPAATGTAVVTECITYDWIDGNTYTASNNTATHTLVGGAANGCDSIITLDLTINTVDVQVTDNAPLLTANATLATYNWLDCDDLFSTMNVTTADFTASENGNYAVEVTQNGCVDTSACFSVTNVGLEDNNPSAEFKVYPNPTSGQVQVEGIESISSITLYNILGERIQIQYPNQKLLNLDLSSYPAGIYLIEIYTLNHKTEKIRLVKE